VPSELVNGVQMLDHVPAGNARPRGQFRIEHHISSRNYYSNIYRRQPGGRRAIYFIIRVSGVLLHYSQALTPNAIVLLALY
jgi:hypothetical protein